MTWATPNLIKALQKNCTGCPWGHWVTATIPCVQNMAKELTQGAKVHTRSELLGCAPPGEWVRLDRIY